MYNLTSNPQAITKFESDMFEMARMSAWALKPYDLSDLPDILNDYWESERNAIAGVVDDLDAARALFLIAHKRAFLIEYFARRCNAQAQTESVS